MRLAGLLCGVGQSSASASTVTLIRHGDLPFSSLVSKIIDLDGECMFADLNESGPLFMLRGGLTGDDS